MRSFYAYEKEADWEDAEDRLRSAVWDLLALDEPMPIEYNDDWREGIFRAAQQATRLLLIKAYDAAFRDYLRREELGLKHEVNLDEREIDKEEKHRTWYAEEIKKARVLNGEKPEPDY